MNDQARTKRLVIVDPGLKDFAGHYFETDKAVANAASAAGYHCVILAHREFSADSIPEAEIRPIYSVGIWTVLSGPFHQWPGNLKAVGKRLYDETMGYFLEFPPHPDDIIYVPNIAPGQLLAIAKLAEALRFTGVRLVLMFRYSGEHLYSTVTKQVFARLEAAARDADVSLVTDSHKLRVELARFTSLPFQILPVVGNESKLSSVLSQASQVSENFHVLCLGNPRYEKGFSEFLDAIEILESRPSGKTLRFTIQTHQPSLLASQRLRRFCRRTHPNVTFVKKALDGEAYHALLASADAVVLPYRRWQYRARTSGVALEAISFGKPVLVTRDTWMADLVLECGNGLLIEDRDPKAIAVGIASLLEHREVFEIRARNAQSYWRQIHNAETFVRLLSKHAATLEFNTRKIAMVITSSARGNDTAAGSKDLDSVVRRLEEQQFTVRCVALDNEFQPHPIGQRSTVEGLNLSGRLPIGFNLLLAKFWKKMRRRFSFLPTYKFERFWLQVEDADAIIVEECIKLRFSSVVRELKVEQNF